MLVNTYSSSLSKSSFLSNTMMSNNHYVSDVEVSNPIYNKNETLESINSLLKDVLSNQSNLFTLFLTLCVMYSLCSYDLRLDSKDNIISPEVYKESQSFWWNSNHYFEIYKLEATSRGREASAYMAVLMHHAIRSEDTRFLKYFFETLNKSNLTSWSLISLLRSTNVYKNNIPLWKDLYLYTQEVVIKEGLNPKREMYGLDRGLSL